MLRSIILALTLLPVAAAAHDFTIGDLSVEHPVAKAVSETAMTSAGFFSITNSGDKDDTLIEVRADFPRVEMHDTMTDDAGVAKMMKMMSVPIAAGDTVMFERGAKHIMFMGLGGIALNEGDTFDAVLVFENAGELKIHFNVEDMKAEMEHEHHDH